MGLLPNQERYLRTFNGFKPKSSNSAKENAKALAQQRGFIVGSPQYCDVKKKLDSLRKEHDRQLNLSRSNNAAERNSTRLQAASVTTSGQKTHKNSGNDFEPAHEELDAAIHAWFRSFKGFPVDASRGWEDNFERLQQWKKAKSSSAAAVTTSATAMNAPTSTPDPGKKWITRLPTSTELSYLSSFSGFCPDASATRKTNLRKLGSRLTFAPGSPECNGIADKMQEISKQGTTTNSASRANTREPSTVVLMAHKPAATLDPPMLMEIWQQQLPTRPQIAYLQSFGRFRADPSADLTINLKELAKHMCWKMSKANYQIVAETARSIGTYAESTVTDTSTEMSEEASSSGSSRSSLLQAELENELLELFEEEKLAQGSFEVSIQDDLTDMMEAMDIDDEDNGGVGLPSAEDEDIAMRQL